MLLAQDVQLQLWVLNYLLQLVESEDRRIADFDFCDPFINSKPETRNCCNQRGDAPGLGHAAAGTVWRVAIEDFRYLAQTRFLKMRPELVQPVCGNFLTCLRSKCPRIGSEVRSHQPGPHCALMVR